MMENNGSLWSQLEHIIPDYINVLSTVIGLTVLYLFVRFYLSADSAQHKAVIPESMCGSPGCVRCHKYKEVSGNSVDRLHAFMAEQGCEVDRILQAVSGTISYTGCERQQPNVLYIAGLEGNPWWASDGRLAEVARSLKEVYEDVVDEYNRAVLMMDRRCGGWTRNNTETGSWDTFYLYNQGVEVTENTQHCPVLAQILKLKALCMTDCVFGNVFFSRLHPGTQISAHYGSCNIRIRCHLGINVPEGWSLSVDGEERSWTERECLLFDDSFLHSVSHQSSLAHSVQSHDPVQSRDQVSRKSHDSLSSKSHDSVSPDCLVPDADCRVVLILDLWHPDLTPTERQALAAIYRD